MLRKSADKGRHTRGSNYVAMATVEQGKPRNRMVVFRGWQDVSDVAAMVYCTDARSGKAQTYFENQNKVLLLTRAALCRSRLLLSMLARQP